LLLLLLLLMLTWSQEMKDRLTCSVDCGKKRKLLYTYIMHTRINNKYLNTHTHIIWISYTSQRCRNIFSRCWVTFCTYVCTYVRVEWLWKHRMQMLQILVFCVPMYICMYVCIYVCFLYPCMYVYMYVFVPMYVCMYIRVEWLWKHRMQMLSFLYFWRTKFMSSFQGQFTYMLF
jgi:hypothetical protein